MALAGLALSGPLGNVALTVLGVGIQAGIALLFPQKIKGPRQENLKAQTSKYGDSIARIYGTVDVAGTVIWLKGDKADEHKSEKRTKAMGPINVEYKYTADFAVAFAWNGPVAGISRIWADNKLIFDESKKALSEAIATGGQTIGKIEGATIKIYTGTDDQLPDANIEADRGAGLVPAYSGLVYIVCTNFPLDEFGIRVPNMKAEVISVGLPEGANVYRAEHLREPITDLTNETFVSYKVNFGGNGALKAAQIPDGSTMWSKVIASPGEHSMMHMVKNGDVVVSDLANDVIHVFDGQTGARKQTIAHAAASATAPNQTMDSVTVDGVTWLFLAFAGRIAAYSTTGSVYTLAYDTTISVTPGVISAGPERLYFINAAGDGLYSSTWSATAVGPPAAASGVTVVDPYAVHYDEASDSVIYFEASTSTAYILNDTLTGTLRSVVSTLDFATSPSRLVSHRMMSAEGQFLVKDFSTGDVIEYKISDVSIVNSFVAADYDWPTASTDTGDYGLSQKWRMTAPVFTSIDSPWWFLPRLSSPSVSLASVIEAECGYVGLDVDVSALTKEIKGYAVREPMPPRGVIEDLQRTQFFDFSQVNGVLTFVERSPTVVATIDIDDLAAVEDDDPQNTEVVLVGEEYADMRELPASISISYTAFDGDYRTGTQSLARPDELDDTKEKLDFSTPLVMTDDEAAQAIDVLFNETRQALTLYKASIPSKYRDLTPGDVIDLPLDAAQTVPAVLMKIEGDSILECEFRLRSMVYSSDAVGQPTAKGATTKAFGNPDLGFIAIDGHLVNADDDDDSFYYGVSRRSRGSFLGANVFRSTDDGGTYAAWEPQTFELAAGYADAALPDRPHPDAIDYASEFVVRIRRSFAAPDSISVNRMLSDETLNAFWVASGSDGEGEYIQAADVEDNGDGTWTLSTLMRGCKGTDFAMAGHAEGDQVVYLNPSAVYRSAISDVGLSRLYAPISSGASFSDQAAIPFVNTARGKRPWSPVHIEGSRSSGDLTVTFLRRDRLGQTWPNLGSEDPPMSETAESYRMFVYDGPDIVNTLTSSTESFSYSSAQQTTDFGSPQSAIDIEIVQVSSTFGDGVARAATV